MFEITTPFNPPSFVRRGAGGGKTMRMLAPLNIKLLRFKNEEVIENVVEMINKIEKCLK